MRALSLVSLLLLACGERATTARFELSADTTLPAHFYDLPYPSDLRLDTAGHPRLAGWPNPEKNALVDGLIASVQSRVRWPVLAVGYVDFDAPLAPRELTDAIATDASAPILLVDLSDTPPARGRLIPVWAQAGVTDEYLPKTALAIAARPGFVLAPDRRYAFVVRRSLRDAAAQALGVPTPLEQLAHGERPASDTDGAATALYASLWPALDELGVARDEVAAATVFTTGDAVAETARLTDAVLAAHSLTITSLALDPAPTDGYCTLHGTVSFPQFQAGAPPFNTDGLLVLDGSGTPVKQRDEGADVVITVPKSQMPPGGYPLVLYFHGSGGDPKQITDAGPIGPGGDEAVGIGKGPASVLSPEGFAVAGTTLPVAPGRLAGASDYAYLNFNNFAATRDIFRQGVIEQRLFVAAMAQLSISPSLLAGCAGPSLPAGATAFRFDASRLSAQGQSMGGMYANLVSAVEPRVKAVVPTGAGGYWAYFILETSIVPGATVLLANAFNIQTLTLVHPLLTLFEAATEPSDPIVSAARLAHRPLAGHPVRSVYEPVGFNDEYFPTTVYDAMALAYDHQQAGELVWPTMQDALASDGRGGLVAYPIEANRRSTDGRVYTGAVVQYRGDGVADPHQIYRQLDAVKYQYRCFLRDVDRGGAGLIAAPATLASACPR